MGSVSRNSTQETMAEFDKGVPTNDDDQVAIVGGPGSASGGAGAPVPGGALGHYHNPEDDEIGLVLDDGYANKSVDESDGEDLATIRDMKREMWQHSPRAKTRCPGSLACS